jgi:2-polyprenyl-6-methoxyphenol hydroxylase-like FAD-dependent oxidoreductase
MPQVPRILIIGGGLGGLCLAQALRRTDCEVAVYERDDTASARAQGYRISLDTRGAGALRECLPPKLYELFEATSGQPSTGMSSFVVEGDALREVSTERFPVEASQGIAMPGHAVDRLTLRETLLAGLEDVAHFGKEFTRYELLKSGGVRAHFADGTAVDGDVLVAADGVASRVRQQHLPHAALLDTGVRWLGGRTVLDDDLMSMLPEALSDRAIVISDGKRHMFLASVVFQHAPNQAAAELWPGLRYTNGDNFLMWAFVGPKDHFLAPDEQLAARTGPELHQLALESIDGGHPLQQTIVETATPDRSFFLAIRTVAPVEQWATGPVTYIGDAIHAAPVNGTGANAALEDAAAFSRHVVAALAGDSPIPDAVHNYEIEMLRNARARQAGFRAAGARMHANMHAHR